MRGTSKISNSNNLLYISRNFHKLNKTSGQLANQRQVMELKDDPMSANIGIQMNQLVARAEQYSRNIKSGMGQLSLSDTRLQTAKKQMDSIYTILTGAANEPSTTAETRSANVTQLNEIFKTLVNLGNTSDGTRYIFGGSRTTSSPFEIVNGRYVSYTGNTDKISIVADQNTSIPINTTGPNFYGNMTTKIPSKDMNPDVNLSTDRSTRLDDLNGGEGVPKGKIVIKYSGYPNGLEVDLTNCDTLEDVKDAIEQQTLEASRLLDPREHTWLDGSNMDWHDYQDRYVKVTVNPDKNGISLMEYDLGEPLPAPTKDEIRRNVHQYSGGAWAVNGAGIAAGSPGKEVTVFDKADSQGRYNAFGALSVDDYASNKVAEGLGIRGTATMPKLDGAGQPIIDPTKSGYLHGRDVNPVLSDRTLLADLDGYNDSTYTFTNGPKTGTIEVSETSQDPNNIFNSWDLDGITIGKNTGKNGELYAKVVKISSQSALTSDTYFNPPLDIEGPATFKAGQTFGQTVTINGTEYKFPDDQPLAADVSLPANEKLSFKTGLTLKQGTVLSDHKITVQLYTQPVDKATAADLVAVGAYDKSLSGGTVTLEEVNSSGLSGKVGIVLPSGTKEATVSLKASFPDSKQGSVHVPAFKEELNADGTPRDSMGIFSGWNIRGLDKPPAESYDQNHPASTDLEGNFSVNYRYENGYMHVELSRPSFGGQPAKVVAEGKMYVGNTPTDASVSGRIEFVGKEGFEGVSGSVYVELPAGATFGTTGGVVGTDKDHATTNTFPLQSNAPAGTVVLGGATEFEHGISFAGTNTFKLSDETRFKEGQVFQNDIRLPGGGTLPAGMALPYDVMLPKGQEVQVTSLEPGTILAAGQEITFNQGIPAGTVIPRGSYYTSAGGGFPAPGMGLSANGKTMDPGFDVQATFATIEDLKRAIEELNIHVHAEVSSDGKGLEFTSRLAGAWLTVSEDTDCYEQMGDTYNQLSGLDLNGLVKGENSDTAGNVYTEVIFYPPNNPEYDAHGNYNPVRLIGDDGSITEIKPGYYVRVYSDKEALNRPYETRDNSSMVAEGYVAPGKWNNGADPLNPFDPDPAQNVFTPGVLNGMKLEERNNSGVNGTVDLNYYGGRNQATPIMDDQGNVTGYDSSPYQNDNITIFPGGMRPGGSDYATIQEVDVYDVTNGIHTDYNGTIHGTLTKKESPADPDVLTPFEIAFHRDKSHATITGRSNQYEAVGADGTVNIYSVNEDGKFLDKHGNIIEQKDVATLGVVIGTMTIDAATLMDPGVENGTVDSFSIKTGANRNYGQEREQNIFSTINDAIDALNRNDTEMLHNLLGDIQRDLALIEDAMADVGSREKRMNLLNERHADDVVKFSDIFTKRVGMDDTALAKTVLGYQAATNSYQAAMQVSASIMQMSLLQYI